MVAVNIKGYPNHVHIKLGSESVHAHHMIRSLLGTGIVGW